MKTDGNFQPHDFHIRQCLWEIGSASAERAGQGEVDGCTRNSMAASGLSFEQPLLEPGIGHFSGFKHKWA